MMDLEFVLRFDQNEFDASNLKKAIDELQQRLDKENVLGRFDPHGEKFWLRDVSLKLIDIDYEGPDPFQWSRYKVKGTLRIIRKDIEKIINEFVQGDILDIVHVHPKFVFEYLGENYSGPTIINKFLYFDLDLSDAQGIESKIFRPSKNLSD